MDCINLHTHHRRSPLDIVVIDHDFAQTPDGYFTAGFHPWYLEKISDQDVSHWNELIQHPWCVGIGECGLDAVIPTPMSLQQSWFDRQIKMANSLHKPLIIHCARAYDPCLNMLKKATTPVVFHGFNRNERLAKKVLDAGHCISLQKILFQADVHWLSAIPLDRVFLETDNSDQDIKEVLQQAARIWSTSEMVFAAAVKGNAERIFGRSFESV